MSETRKGDRNGAVPEKSMEERIRSLYVRMLQEENQKERISRKTQEAVQNLWEEKDGEKSPGQKELLDKMLLAACAAEENGFVMGFRYAFRLFTECIQE